MGVLASSLFQDIFRTWIQYWFFRFSFTLTKSNSDAFDIVTISVDMLFTVFANFFNNKIFNHLFLQALLENIAEGIRSQKTPQLEQ